MERTLVVARSTNAKLGPMSATYREQTTCPTTCPLYQNGCYARGRNFSHARRGSTQPGAIVDLARIVRPGGAVRLNVSGDLLGPDGTLDTEHAQAASELARRRPDLDLWTYTHAWRTLDPDPVPGAVVNASCETESDILDATGRGWQAVVTDPGPQSPDTLIGRVIAGRRVVQCPSQTHPGVTCDTCRMCAREGDRRPVIAFAVHGSGAGLARAAIAARREQA